MFCTKYFAALFAFSFALRAQIVPDQFIVELTAPPVLNESRREMAVRRAGVRAQQSQLRQSVSKTATILDSVEMVANALLVETSDPDSLRNLAGVSRVLPVYELHPLLDVMTTVHHVPDAIARLGAQGKAGAGVKIGILDTGIDRNHAGFQDDTLPALDGYPKVSDDQILPATSKKIIVGRAYDGLNRAPVNLDIEDRVGHGTSVAMVAAGVANTGPFGTIAGFAPKAYLGVYRVFSGGTLRNATILKALDDAAADGMDIVSMSFGSPFPIRSDLDVVTDAIERAIASGMIVVVAAGNSGPDSYTVGTPSSAPSAVTAGASYNARRFTAGVRVGDQIWLATVGGGPLPAQPAVGGIVDVASAGDPDGKLCVAGDRNALRDKIALIARGDCLFEVKLNNAQAAGAIAAVVYSTQASPQRIQMGVGSATLPAMMVDYGDGIALKKKLQTDSLVATLQFEGLAVAQEPSRLAEFSSHGPSVDAAIKPDLIAVGTDVSTAAESKYPDGDVYAKSGYLVVEGTSFSTPATAGAMAVLKAGRPGLKASQYSSLLVNSASPLLLADGSTAPVMTAGAGLMNLDAAAQSVTALAPVSSTFGIGNGSPDRSRMVNVTNLGSDVDTFRISVSSRDSTAASADVDSLTIDPGKTQSFSLSFKGKDLAGGEYQGFVTVKADNNPIPARMAYWYGVSGTVPAGVVLIKQDDAKGVNSTATFDFAISDATGMPYYGPQPQVTVVSGDGLVRTIQTLAPAYPGVWEATVRLGPSAGSNVFHIESGDAKRNITIFGQ